MSAAASDTMRAVVITRFGGPEVLEVRTVPLPLAAAGEILVRVRATALNRADLLQRQGRYPAPPGAPADIPGMEFAGEVASCGPGAERWKEGDRVFGIVAGGSYAEYLTCHESVVSRVPDSMDWEMAGSIPEVFVTAHDAMITQAGLRAGETVLIHAAGSGVALAAMQLARELGARVLGTARTADKIERARAYGLTSGLTVGGSLEALPEWVKSETEGRGADVVLDLVGGDYPAASIAAAAPRARIMLIGTVAGPMATLPLGMLLGKRITMRGTVLRARSVEEKAAAMRAFEAEVVPLLASGAVTSVIDRTFTLDDAAAAHRYLESNESFGKVVLGVMQ
ncbi:MAG: quinone oxidoreductase, family [Gemmatimonadetes bacterium]|nr:quinone oxidoreductase, family [Gemmatimonadota bacterium]